MTTAKPPGATASLGHGGQALRMAGCLSCDTLVGRVTQPGGWVLRNEHWSFCLRRAPLLVAGEGLILLNRHCEDVAALTEAEAAALGSMMRAVAAAMTQVLQAERVHFGLYAEEVRHLHCHVLPRTGGLPAGNVPITLLRLRRGALRRLGLGRAFGDDEVAAVAAQLREAVA